MRKGTFLATVAAMVLSVAPAALAEEAYSVVNSTGMDITHLYVSAHEEDSWGDDILGRDVLPDGEECEIEFANDDDRCAWDFKIIDGNGQGWKVMNVDLCQVHHLTFSSQGGSIVYSAN